MTDILHFDRDNQDDEIAAALNREGVVALDDWAPCETMDQVEQELRPYFDKEGENYQDDFNGYQTLRLSGILARSRTAAELIANERVLAIVGSVLLPYCINYRIGSTTAIEICPGENAQLLHRDDSIYPIQMLGMELQVSTLWAFNEFTEENGATVVVPGSHRWSLRDRVPIEAETTQATMSKGSVLIYLGSVFHGGGANRSSHPRLALVNTYSLGWLRQEENQYLTIPAEIVDSYPEKIRRLMGYQGHGEFLGWFPDNPDGYH